MTATKIITTQAQFDRELSRLQARTYKAEASYHMWRDRSHRVVFASAEYRRIVAAEERAYSRMIDAANAEQAFACTERNW
jgi:hypothetical protein